MAKGKKEKKGSSKKKGNLHESCKFFLVAECKLIQLPNYPNSEIELKSLRQLQNEKNAGQKSDPKRGAGGTNKKPHTQGKEQQKWRNRKGKQVANKKFCQI